MPFARTGESAVSDDELMILDALFDMWMPLGCLTRDRYREICGYDYCHSLPDSELLGVVARLVACGLVQVARGCDDQGRPIRTGRDEPIDWNADRLCLTPKGGGVWEAERDPDWERFCADREGGDVPPVRTIVSVSRESAYGYLAWLNQCEICSWLWGEVTEASAKDFAIVPWKRMARVTILVAVGVRSIELGPHDDLLHQMARMHKYWHGSKWWGGVAGLPIFRAGGRQESH